MKKGKNVYCLSLGCAKNRVDSERFLAVLEKRGFSLVSKPEGADICIVNTCGFIQPAVEESIAAILDLLQLRDQGQVQKVGVVGCLLNRYKGDLQKELSEVDFWAVSEDIDSLLEGIQEAPVAALPTGRTLIPGQHSFTRYLKLVEGCDNKCTYCTIPAIRGSVRSLSVKQLVEESQQLILSGAKELCLVGQDLTVYGTDWGGSSKLIELLDALESSLPKDIWLRLLYLHPNRVDRPLLERVARGHQLLPYLDIPIQHASPEILAAMNRASPEGFLEKLFAQARAIRSDFTLRTTCMVGFPGERKKHFDDLLRFLKKAQLDRVGAFTYWPEEGTPAASMKGRVSEKTKQSRLQRLMSLQQEISFKRQRLFVGAEMDVLVESISEGVAEGRSFREAPEVDGIVEIQNVRRDLQIGDKIRVRMIEAMEHDMIGEEV